MKKIFAVALFAMLLLPQLSQAQIEKGGKLVAIDGLFSKPTVGKDSKIKSHSTNFSLSQLFMLSNRIGLGYFSNIVFSGGKVQYQDQWSGKVDVRNKNFSFHIGPSARYFFPVNPTNLIFAEVKTGLGRSWDSTYQSISGNIDDSIVKSGSWLSEANIGMTNFLASNVALETKVGYGKTVLKYDDEKFNVKNIGLHMGLVFYFNKKGKNLDE